MTETAHAPTSWLQASLARVAALDPQLQARVIERLDGGWFGAADLIERPERLDEALQQVMAPYGEEARRIMARQRHIAAAFLINGYAWVVPAAAIGMYVSERRVPDLDPSNVALRFAREDGDGERALEVAFVSQRMAVLADDPAARSPAATVVPNAAQLRTWLRTRLEAHMAPLIEAVYRRTGFGRRAQWNLVADACAALFLWAGKATGDPEQACAEGLAFVGAPDSPMNKSKTGYFTLHYRDRCETFRKRGGCCLYYRISNGDHCSTCSLISEVERDRRLLGWMATQYAEEQRA